MQTFLHWTWVVVDDGAWGFVSSEFRVIEGVDENRLARLLGVGCIAQLIVLVSLM